YTSGTAATLTAAPASGNVFSGWGGSCSGSGTSATVTVDAAKTCTAEFVSQYTLSVTKTGNGTVTSSPSGINCGADCSEAYTSGTAATLTVAPASGNVFSGWGGSCSGSGTSATVTVDAAKICTAEFTKSVNLGMAIIIAGGGAQQSNTLFPYSNNFTQRMYRLLRMRGYTDEDIIYLNPHAPDIEPLDGYPEAEKQDFDLFDPEPEINLAFAQVISRLLAGQQFVLYVHGHAEAGYLDIRPPYKLSASRLRELLDSLPDGVEQVVILDACFSGSFIRTLATPGRTILSSSDDVSYAWNTEYDSFSDLLIRGLRLGQTLFQAFERARQKLMESSGENQSQTPWLDDDGDGVFSSRDGMRSEALCLGACGVSGYQIDIQQIRPAQDINSNSALLWAAVSLAPKNIRQVRAVLRGPEASVPAYQGQNTVFGRIETELSYNADEKHYEAVYDRFCTPGLWDVFYQAQGADGAWSDIVKGQVRQTQTPDLPICQSDVSVTMLLNQFEYQAGDDFRLDMRTDGQREVIPYIAIVFPSGDFVTYSYAQGFSFTNMLYTYRDLLNLNGSRTYPIMQFTLPPGIPAGQYQACGVLMNPSASDVLNMENWLDFECKTFTLR
ncbi:MAG: hypothetical protein GY862_21620, partial [Gammaproteobacteria bacterium]|nr:hypothetical protein [Gammaproteobacteria bacterium]